MYKVLFSIWLAFLFMMRGGLIKNLKGEKIVFSLLFAVSSLVQIYFQYECITTSQTLYLIPLCIYAISAGWGKWVVAILDGNINNMESEDKEFDKLISRFEKYPVLWGVLGVTYRGAIMGLLLGAPFSNFWMILAGASMGLCFYLARLTGQLYTLILKRQLDTWKIGEFYTGLALSAGLLLNNPLVLTICHSL